MSDNRPTREECEKWAKCTAYNYALVELKRFACEVLALLDENANLKRDKERLDWLNIKAEYPIWPDHLNIREAIDAAMESTASEGEPKA